MIKSVIKDDIYNRKNTSEKILVKRYISMYYEQKTIKQKYDLNK